ncbi:MAG: hypothetical protein HUK14_10195 [Muribaculaceae bacterium]|nr:hypothetical protein [Muribaculaceae bacterium]
MTEEDFIKSLKIEENVFELLEDTELEYIEHFAAPFTGGNSCIVPKGFRFYPEEAVGSDTFYLYVLNDINEELCKGLLEKMINKVKEQYPAQLAQRLTAFTFFITEKQVEEAPLHFISGSKERLLEIFRILKQRTR